MSESEYWAEQGVIPKKNNLIYKMVRSVTGLYNSQDTDFIATARDREEQSYGELQTVLLRANRDLNRMDEISTTLFQEFIISASVFLKENYGYWRGKTDTWTHAVSLNNMFFDGVLLDARHWDVSMIGQTHDLTFGELCSKFCKTNDDHKRLKEIYTNALNESCVS